MGFRSKTEDNSSFGVNSLAVAKPSGVLDGDILLVAFGVDDLPNSVPAGWDAVSDVAQTDSQGAILSVYKKVASGEGASWTWGWASNQDFRTYGAMCLAYEGDTNIAGEFDNGTEPSNGSIRYVEHVSSEEDVTVVYFELGRWFSVGTGPITHEWDGASSITERVKLEDSPGSAFNRTMFVAGDEVIPSGNIPLRTNLFSVAVPPEAIGVAGIRNLSSFLTQVEDVPSVVEIDLRLLKVDVGELPHILHTRML